MLHINALSYRIGPRILLNEATVHIAANQRVGLVGRNGSGKSTLFRLIRGEAQSSGGSINVRPRASLGWVSQDAPDGNKTLIACVLDADIERKTLLDELESLGMTPDGAAGMRIAEIHERLVAIDAHSAPSRAAIILTGLGFSPEQQEHTVNMFSGGWQMRVALAAALFTTPDILLLDEPTNHLDLEATLWLQSHLMTYPGTLLIISHDRELLNSVPDRIIHLDQQRLVAYAGNYDTFERTRRMKMELAAKALGKQIEQRRKIQGFVDRFRAKASKAKQAQSRIKKLEKMEIPVAVVEDQTISFDFPEPDHLSPPLITIENGVIGYDGKPILKGLDLRIDGDDRIALLGANGNGKSTLAKLLSDRLPLMEGTLRKSNKIKIGYFAQYQTDELDVEATPYDHMAKLMPMAIESKVRAQLGRFGFTKALSDSKVGTLSGGEKSRLLFALMTRNAPHILILDEPTNHLDIDSRESLISALNAYEGTVILISHDTHLIEMVADRLWRVADGGCLPFDNDLEEYRRLLLEERRTSTKGGKSANKQDSASTLDQKAERKLKANRRNQLAPIKKVMDNAEKKLDRLIAEANRVEDELADPALYGADNGASTMKLQKELSALKQDIAVAETKWMKTVEDYENAEAAMNNL